MRKNNSTSQNRVNLVSARSRSNVSANELSRKKSVDGYAQLRRKRALRKNILMGTGITLAALLAATLVALAVYTIFINNKLGTDLHGNRADFNSGVYDGVFVAPEKPEDPFWVLLMGTDNREGYELPRTDTLILARIDQQNKKAALVSIPRDLYVDIPGYGAEKINAAYTYAEMDVPGSGPAQTVKTVQAFAGVDIAYFAQVDFNGLVQLVDGLGGVEVDVPVDIIGDSDAGGLDIYAGLQTLDGAHALTFCRSRQFDSGDYQRQANQRTFLQALARQVLASDLPTIASTMTNMANMTFTNMDLATVVKVAQGMQGMQENSIHTYYVPSTTKDMLNAEGMVISYVVPDTYSWQQLISSLNAGEYPEHQEDPYAGVVPDSYLPSTAAADQLAGQESAVVTSDYVVDVRNGYGIQGSATGISDMLTLAGYKRGEIGNAESFVYDTTLVIYKDEKNRAIADDIRRRIGYGKVIASLNRYIFDGDILVVVGGEFDR
ncbi:MAG: LCP family protein [Coriobacteriales bacterium]|jgi:LCP family protein required for cell wall assembly|nr:LCP family protein [Coriobacteriales bacterium]